MMDTNFKNLVAFCILMENGDGILDKSPDYIAEKFKRFQSGAYTDGYMFWGLDHNNQLKLQQ